MTIHRLNNPFYIALLADAVLSSCIKLHHKMNFYIAWINTYSRLKDLTELSHELEVVSFRD